MVGENDVVWRRVERGYPQGSSVVNLYESS